MYGLSKSHLLSQIFPKGVLTSSSHLQYRWFRAFRKHSGLPGLTTSSILSPLLSVFSQSIDSAAGGHCTGAQSHRVLPCSSLVACPAVDSTLERMVTSILPTSGSCRGVYGLRLYICTFTTSAAFWTRL